MADRWENYFGPGDTLLWEGAPVKRWGLVLATVAMLLFRVSLVFVCEVYHLIRTLQDRLEAQEV